MKAKTLDDRFLYLYRNFVTIFRNVFSNILINFCKQFEGTKTDKRRCQCSSVSTATRLRAGRSRFDPRQGQGRDFFLFFPGYKPAVRPMQPPIQRISGALSSGEKQRWRKADDSPPSNAEVKKTWSYNSTPQYVFIVRCLIKHIRLRDLVLS
jgi:hypothetical protein